MNDARVGDTQDLTGWAKLVIALTIVLISVGAIWHGDTLKSWSHLMRDLSDRPSGPLSFRFILQPAMAMIAAFHDGVQDARTGRSPYFWTVLTNPRERIARLNEGLVST